VIVILGAADRDPERFEEPDTLDLAAKRESRHLGFGRGSHFCLGAPLARLETEIALGTSLRLPGLRLAVAESELRWRPVPLFRSLVALPVAWDA
jgi:cytochrome P450